MKKTFRELYMLAYDMLSVPDGDRRIENIIKSGINFAYIWIASRDHGVIEMEYELDGESSLVYLPDDFLSLKRIKHSTAGLLSKEDFSISNNVLILGDSVPLDGSLDLILALTPEPLVEDTDVPKISRKYHMALVYYGMYAYSGDDSHLMMYNSEIGELASKDEMSDDAGGAEYVQDIYHTRYDGGDW